MGTNPHIDRSKFVKIVVFAPESHAALIRKTMGEAGGGRLGKYSFCSFSSKGTGRFKPGKGSHPAIGKIGKMETVQEARIETTCERDFMGRVVAALKKSILTKSRSSTFIRWRICK